MNEIQLIVKELLPLKKELPETVLIGRLTFVYPCEAHEPRQEMTMQIKERRRGNTSNYFITYNQSHCLLTGVFVESSGQNDYKPQIQGSGQFFTGDQIHDFVDRIDDQNPIHRNSPRVVPGLLLLERLLVDLANRLSHKKWLIGVRFITPLMENETYEIAHQPDGAKMMNAMGNELIRLTLEEK